MLDLDLPLIIPSDMCSSKHFENFIGDLSLVGIRKIIITHDFDFSSSNIFSHRDSLKKLKKNISPIFKSKNVKFRIVTNALLEPKVYSVNELSCIAEKDFEYYFLTIPLSCEQSVAMKNIFTLKNEGLLPVISSFENVAVIFKKSFCEALITTEDISFVYDSEALSDEKIISYINKSLSSHNSVAFSVSHFTTSIIERNILGFWENMENQKRMNLGYFSSRLTNKFFR